MGEHISEGEEDYTDWSLYPSCTRCSLPVVPPAEFCEVCEEEYEKENHEINQRIRCEHHRKRI
jgi:hypothetical protein